jgi:hypothetical protein
MADAGYETSATRLRRLWELKGAQGDQAMADITYYVAMPFLHDESGMLIAGNAEECQSPTAALLRAEMMSRSAGNIGAIAFSRSGDPMMGEFSDARLLRKFGHVPDDLGGL